jgi:hypothetical protein
LTCVALVTALRVLTIPVAHLRIGLCITVGALLCMHVVFEAHWNLEDPTWSAITVRSVESSGFCAIEWMSLLLAVIATSRRNLAEPIRVVTWTLWTSFATLTIQWLLAMHSSTLLSTRGELPMLVFVLATGISSFIASAILVSSSSRLSRTTRGFRIASLALIFMLAPSVVFSAWSFVALDGAGNGHMAFQVLMNQVSIASPLLALVWMMRVAARSQSARTR